MELMMEELKIIATDGATYGRVWEWNAAVDCLRTSH